MARKRSKALGTAQSMTPAMPIANVLDASAFGIEDIVTTPSSIPKPVLQMPAVSGPAPTLKLPSLQTVINGVHSANTGSYEYASSSGAKTSGYEDLAAEQMYRPSAEPAPLRGNQAFDLRGAMNQSILADDDLANQMANGREAAAKARWDANTAEGDEIQKSRKIDKAVERYGEASQARASQKAHDEKIAAEKAEAEKAKIAKRDRAVGRILNYLDTDDDLDDGIHGVTKQDFVDRALDLKKKNPKYKEALEGLGKKRLGDLYDSYGKDRRETLRLQGALDESAEAAEAARAKKVRDAALQEYYDPKNIGDGYLGVPTGDIDKYYDQLLAELEQERAHQQKLSTEVASRAKAEEVAKTHADAAQKRINDATGVSNGGRHLSSQETNDIVGLFTRQGQYASGKGYNTENDAVLGEKIRKARKDFMEKNGGKAGDFDEALRKNPGMILDENDKGLLRGLNTFLERKDLAQQNVTVYKKDLQNRLKKIEDRTKGKSFEDLRYQEGGKGFLSKAETEAIQKKTTGMHGLGARLRDNLGKAVNKATFGHAHVRTNRAEEIRNTEAQKIVNQRRGAIKNQIKSAGQQLQDIKEYREDAIEGGRSRNAIRKYRRNEVKQQKKAAAAKKAGKLNLGWKAKAGAVGGLLALGAVLGSMMGGHGEQSNAQLYNPNPQPQYAN